MRFTEKVKSRQTESHMPSSFMSIVYSWSIDSSNSKQLIDSSNSLFLTLFVSAVWCVNCERWLGHLCLGILFSCFEMIHKHCGTHSSRLVFHGLSESLSSFEERAFSETYSIPGSVSSSLWTRLSQVSMVFSEVGCQKNAKKIRRLTAHKTRDTWLSRDLTKFPKIPVFWLKVKGIPFAVQTLSRCSNN